MHSDTQTVLFAGPQVAGVLVSWTNPAALPSVATASAGKFIVGGKGSVLPALPRSAPRTPLRSPDRARGATESPVPELRSPLTKRAGSSCHGSVVGVSGTATGLTSRTARLRCCLLGVACRVVHGRSAAGIAPRRPPWGVGQWFF